MGTGCAEIGASDALTFVGLAQSMMLRKEPGKHGSRREAGVMQGHTSRELTYRNNTWLQYYLHLSARTRTEATSHLLLLRGTKSKSGSTEYREVIAGCAGKPYYSSGLMTLHASQDGSLNLTFGLPNGYGSWAITVLQRTCEV